MADTKERIEIELALRDMMSGILRQTTNDIDAFYKKFLEGQTAVNTDATKAGHAVVQLGEKAKQSTGSIFSLGTSLKAIAEGMGGPVGIVVGTAAAVVTAANILESYAKGQVGLKSLSTDTGLTIEQIKKMQAAIVGAGGTYEQATGIIADLSKKIQDMRIEERGDAFYRALSAGGQNIALAERVLAASKAGDTMAGIAAIVETYMRQTSDAARTYYADILKTNKSYLEALRQQNLDQYHPRVPSDEELQRLTTYHKRWVDQVENFWKVIGQRLQQAGISKLIGISKKSYSEIFAEGLMTPWTIAPELALKYMFTRHGPQQQEKREKEQQGNWLLGEIAQTLHRIAEGAFGGGRSLLFRPGIGPRAWRPGGPAALVDEKGAAIDPNTMQQAEEFVRKGDLTGLERMFSQRGFQMGARSCGLLASKFARAAGFAPPPGGATATNWHLWGYGIQGAGVNEPNRPLGSIFATYNYNTYGPRAGQPVVIGREGSHVFTVFPGSFNPKTNEIEGVDQYGVRKHVNVNDVDIRYAGDEVVKEVQAKRAAAAAQQKLDVTPDLSNFVKFWESFRARPFNDIGGGVNIGYGTAALPGDTVISEEEATKRMNAELTRDRTTIERLNPNLSEGAKRALTSLLYNLGGDVNKLMNHGMREAIAANDTDAIKRSLLEFSHVGGPQGRVLPGLLNRRRAEIAFLDAEERRKTEESIVQNRGRVDRSAALKNDTAIQATIEFKNAPWWLGTVVNHDGVDRMSVTKSINPETMN